MKLRTDRITLFRAFSRILNYCCRVTLLQCEVCVIILTKDVIDTITRIGIIMV